MRILAVTETYLLNPPLVTYGVFEDRNLKSSYYHKCQGFCGSRHAPGGRGNNKKKVEVNKFQRQCLLSNFKFLTACQRSFFPIQDLQLSQETSVFEVFDLVLFVAHHSPSNWKKLTHNKVNSKHELWIIFTAFQFYENFSGFQSSEKKIKQLKIPKGRRKTSWLFNPLTPRID